MGVKCRFLLIPDGTAIEYEGPCGVTYEEALLSIGIIPDTALIFFHGTSLPQDRPIEEDKVEIVVTGPGRRNSYEEAV